MPISAGCLNRSARSVTTRKTSGFPAEFVSTVKELAAAIGFDEELKLLLDWAVSVKAYNMAKIAGDEAAAPLAEAKALLERYPRHARRVQTDWAGGSNSRYYRDDPKKYWPHELDAKLAPVRAALPKLTPLNQADLLESWSGGYYQGGPEVFSVEEARAFVLENPDLANRRSGPSLALGWNSLDLEQARKLAPLLERNPSPEASLIRAIAAAGEEKDLDKAIDALLGPEVWRLDKARLGGRLCRPALALGRTSRRRGEARPGDRPLKGARREDSGEGCCERRARQSAHRRVQEILERLPLGPAEDPGRPRAFGEGASGDSRGVAGVAQRSESRSADAGPGRAGARTRRRQGAAQS